MSDTQRNILRNIYTQHILDDTSLGNRVTEKQFLGEAARYMHEIGADEVASLGLSKIAEHTFDQCKDNTMQLEGLPVSESELENYLLKIHQQKLIY